MSLAAAEEGVYDCCADGRIVVAAEEVVLPADGQRADGILHSVVVDVISAVKNIAGDFGAKAPRKPMIISE